MHTIYILNFRQYSFVFLITFAVASVRVSFTLPGARHLLAFSFSFLRLLRCPEKVLTKPLFTNPNYIRPTLSKVYAWALQNMNSQSLSLSLSLSLISSTC